LIRPSGSDRILFTNVNNLDCRAAFLDDLWTDSVVDVIDGVVSPVKGAPSGTGNTRLQWSPVKFSKLGAYRLCFKNITASASMDWRYNF